MTPARRRDGRARRRDRRVYWRAHPVLFALLAATRRAPVLRLGHTVLVNGTEPFTAALTELPLDRTAPGTTGGTARALSSGGLLFDQDGPVHRSGRRSVGGDLGSAGVQRLRPVWMAVLERRLAPLADGAAIDIVDVVTEMAGATACALLTVDADPLLLARAARQAAAAAVRTELPGPHRATTDHQAKQAAALLTRLVQPGPNQARPSQARPSQARPSPAGPNQTGPSQTGPSQTGPNQTGPCRAGAEPADPGQPALASMVAVAVVSTTVAGIPRAVAWCADTNSWPAAQDDAARAVLVTELLRVVTPAPLLPRVAAGPGLIGGHLVRTGDRLILITRHATGAHKHGPDYEAPAPPQVSQLVFGAGPHACPGAKLARAQLDDVLRLLAPCRPVVVRARADRHSALPGWASLLVRPART